MTRDVPSWLGREFDVVVASATPAGCAAALLAARAGATVLLVEPTPVAGGMNANGVHAFDTASIQALGGISEEFARAVRAHYRAAGLQDPMLESASDLYWESKVAARVWQEMLAAQPRVTLATGMVPVGVETADGFVRRVDVVAAADAFGNPQPDATPWPATGRVFVDASYEGDIAAWAGAAFDLGREARSAREPHAGTIQTTYLNREPVDGWLPQTVLPGSTGEADDAIMAFNCRLTCRIDPQRRAASVSPPANHDPALYRWRRDHFLPGGSPRFGTGAIPSVNGKFLLNVMDRGNDFASGAREYVLAHPAQRGAWRRRFIDHALGFLHHIQTRGESPDVVLAPDEYEGNGGIPYQIYVREGRRIVGDVRIDESDIHPHLRGTGFRPPLRADSIATGDWAIESKKCADTATGGRQWAEGLIHARGVRAPYQVPFGCLVPKGVHNLLVGCALSATHVAYSAVRVESAWTQTGMACGMAAAMAAAGSGRVRDVPLASLQERLLAARAKLTYFADVGSDHPHFEAIQWLALRGEVPHDRLWRFFPARTASWGEFVAMTVRALDVPASVTGAHFEGVEPGDPCFRDYESVYDLASRAGVEAFPGMIGWRADGGADHVRSEPRTRWLHLPPDEPVTRGDAERFVANVRRALGAPAGDVLSTDGSAALSRAEAARLLHDQRIQP